MRRTTLHIVLLVVLGLYYNGAAVAWVAYSTIAKEFFVEHCENPTKPCCKGRCHVKRIEDRSGASPSESGSRVQVTDPQPTIPTMFSLEWPTRNSTIIAVLQDEHPIQLPLESPLRPPRV